MWDWMMHQMSDRSRFSHVLRCRELAERYKTVREIGRKTTDKWRRSRGLTGESMSSSRSTEQRSHCSRVRARCMIFLTIFSRSVCSSNRSLTTSSRACVNVKGRRWRTLDTLMMHIYDTMSCWQRCRRRISLGPIEKTVTPILCKLTDWNE